MNQPRDSPAPRNNLSEIGQATSQFSYPSVNPHYQQQPGQKYDIHMPQNVPPVQQNQPLHQTQLTGQQQPTFHAAQIPVSGFSGQSHQHPQQLYNTPIPPATTFQQMPPFQQPAYAMPTQTQPSPYASAPTGGQVPPPISSALGSYDTNN